MIIMQDGTALLVDYAHEHSPMVQRDMAEEAWAKDKVLLEVRTERLLKAMKALDEIERQWYKPGVYLDTWMIPILDTIKELRNG